MIDLRHNLSSLACRTRLSIHIALVGTYAVLRKADEDKYILVQDRAQAALERYPGRARTVKTVACGAPDFRRSMLTVLEQLMSIITTAQLSTALGYNCIINKVTVVCHTDTTKYNL